MMPGTGFLAVLGLKVSSLVAAFCGSVVNVAVSEKLSKQKAFTALVVGLLCGTYLPKLAMARYQLGETLENSVAFMCGMCGVAVVARILGAVKSKGAA